MTRVLLLLSVVCGGCLIVPATKTSRRQVSTEEGAPSFVASREVTLDAEMTDRVLVVKAKRIGDCTRPVFAVDEITTAKHARLGGASDPRARAFGFLLSPITIPVSALITGLAVAADTAVTSTATRPIGTKRFACSLEADKLTIRVALPSGYTAERTTGPDGRIEIEIPDHEPYAGTAMITAATAPATSVPYTVPKPAVAATRDALIGCAAEHGVSGQITAKLSISNTGRPTRLWVSAGDATFSVCVSKQLGSLRFPKDVRGGTVALPFVLPATTAAR